MVREEFNEFGRSRLSRSISQAGLVPGLVVDDMTDYDNNRLRPNWDRRYSNLLDLPGVNLHPKTAEKITTPWLDSQDFNMQERRFFKDFRPFFLLCQLSGMFPYKLNWKLPFVWGYWATILCLVHLIILVFLLAFYIIQVAMVINVKAGLLYVSYNLAWVVHIAHSIDWILVFFIQKKLFVQIFQGYRKFYRYLLADRSDKSVINFTWKTFVAWEIMFYITAAALVLKSYYDRFVKDTNDNGDGSEATNEQKETCVKLGFAVKETNNRTILATVDQLEIFQYYFSKEVQDVFFWIHLVANIICINVVFLSEVFFMVMISIIFHAFSFIHKQIDGLLGNPDSIFNISVVHEPVDDIETECDNIVRREVKTTNGLRIMSALSVSPKRAKSGKSFHSHSHHQENGISIRALWEQMEELIDLLEQVNQVFGMTLQFLSLEYLLLFPALLYFCIELYPSLSAISLGGFATTVIILGIRSFVFTSVCARVHKETVAPINTLYRAYVKGDVPWHDYDLVHMFINRLSSTTIAVRTWSHVAITRQTFSVIFVAVFGILAVLLQSQHNDI